MAFLLGGTTYHADSDADDEYERSIMTSPTQLHTDSEASPTDSEPLSAEHTPTTYGDFPGDRNSPRTVISEWTAEECADFVAGLGLRQYCDAFIENEIVGEALVALKHDELKEMGITSVGHRLTILKSVYETKVKQDVPIDPDHYIPISAEQNNRHETATQEDLQRVLHSIRLRDERIVQAEAELRRVADEYRKLREELLPIFKMAKDRSQPLPYDPPNTLQPATSPDLYGHGVTSPPIIQEQKAGGGLARTFSKKLFLGSTPKNNSPTHIPNAIQQASMSGGSLANTSPNAIPVPSPTSPAYHGQTLASRSYARDGQSSTSRSVHDHGDDHNRAATAQNMRDPPQSASSASSRTNANNTMSTSSTLVQTPHTSTSVTTPHTTSAPTGTPASSGTGDQAPSVEIFKSFRVGLEDPCYKVLPAALRKYNIQADWRQYALYIVFGDQERCVGLEEKPLSLFKMYDREGKRPMFMLRRLAAPQEGGDSSQIGASQSTMNSAASIRQGQGVVNVPGGVL